MVDAIIVLGCRFNPDGTLNEIGKSRMDKAIGLFKRNHGASLLLSGYKGFASKDESILTEAKVMRKYALMAGIGSKRIFLEEKSKDTIGNIYFSKIIAKKNDWKKIIVVTSDYHLERTKFVCKYIFGKGYDIKCVAAKSNPEIRDKLSEKVLFQVYKGFFSGIREGDDAAIRKQILEKHPGYKK